MSPNKRILIAGALLVLALAAVLLIANPPEGERDALEGDARRAHDTPAPMTAKGLTHSTDGSTPGLETPGLEGRAAEQPAPGDTASHGLEVHVLEVHVVDRHDKPLPGVAVVLLESRRSLHTEQLARARTDRQGVARFPGHTPETVRWAHARSDARIPNDGPLESHGTLRESLWPLEPHWPLSGKVTDWVTKLTCRGGMPFRVVCFDIETGKEIPDVLWGAGRIEEGGTTVVVGQSIAARPGYVLEGGFHVDPPQGYVAYERTGARLPIARTAKSLLFHYPLHREVPMEVTLRRGDGKALQGDVFAEFQFDHTDSIALAMERIAAGRYRMRGMPHIPGLSFGMDIHVGDVSAHWEGILPPKNDRRMQARLTLRKDGARLNARPSNAPPPTGGLIGLSDAPRPLDPPEPERGTLTALCRLGDGAPARDTRVHAEGPWWSVTGNDGQVTRDRYRMEARTNASGRVTFDGAAVGQWTLSFRDWTTVRGKAVVRRNERTELVLQEPLGGSLAVTVVDGDDKPIPFARMGLLAYGDSEAVRPVPDADGVQRADSFTDPAGAWTLNRIAAGMYEITVRWHDQSLVMHVRVVEGQTTHRKLTVAR